MIKKILWPIALIIIALLTAAIQLDRQARVSPTYATIVPKPFRAFAQARVSAAAIAADNSGRALSEAELLVRKRPMPAQNLRLLATAQYRADMAAQSNLTIQYAARRGWRDPIPQEAMMRLALAAGDEAEAARRYLALFLNAQTSDDLLVEMGQKIFADERGDGRKTLTTVVAGASRWLPTFLRRGVRVLPNDVFAQTVVLAKQQGASFDCAQLEAAANSLAKADSIGTSSEMLAALLKSECE